MEEDSPASTFKVTPLSFEILKALPGLRPAPYLASRSMSWIQYFAAPGLGDDELKDYLRNSHRLVALGLTRVKRRELGLDRSCRYFGLTQIAAPGPSRAIAPKRLRNRAASCAPGMAQSAMPPHPLGAFGIRTYFEV
jgi:hypothetical protein